MKLHLPRRARRALAERSDIAYFKDLREHLRRGRHRRRVADRRALLRETREGQR